MGLLDGASGIDPFKMRVGHWPFVPALCSGLACCVHPTRSLALLMQSERSGTSTTPEPPQTAASLLSGRLWASGKKRKALGGGPHAACTQRQGELIARISS